jgi:16S rRNA (guanine966-N2)-methyltransferase
MRVIAGQLRGRPITVPPSGTRPTTDMVRGSIVNSLVSLDVVEGARVADLYAGSGAMGIELLSRGAAHCTFVEKAPDAVRVIRANLMKLRIAERATVLAADAISASRTLGPIDILIADPPYGFGGWDELLAGSKARVAVLEGDAEVEPPAGWQLSKHKVHGRTHVSFLLRVP